MKVGAMILAAGNDRVGDQPKATLALSGTSIIKREINLLREAGVSSIVVVAGPISTDLEKHIAHRKVPVIINEQSESGDMLLSIKKGLEALTGLCDAAIVLPVDMPAFLPDTLKTMEAAADNGQYDMVIPTNHGKGGHPVLILMNAAPKIMDFQERGGLRGMIDTGVLRPNFVEVADPGISIELNQQNDPNVIIEYDVAMLHATPLHATVQVSLARKKEFLSEELIHFLCTVDEIGSMNGACQKLGIAYSRAWTMMNQAEQQLGFPLIERLAGGKGGGSSVLTQPCRDIIEKYEKFSDSLNQQADQLFEEIFLKR